MLLRIIIESVKILPYLDSFNFSKMSLGNKPKAQEYTNCYAAEFVLIDWYTVCLICSSNLGNCKQLVFTWSSPMYIYSVESHVLLNTVSLINHE